MQGWAECPGQLRILDQCGPLAEAGQMTWEETAALVSDAEGPVRSTNACKLRWYRRGGSPQPDRVGSDALAEELLAEQAQLKLDRLVWEQERQLVLNEAGRLRRENVRLRALNNVVLEAFERSVVTKPVFAPKAWVSHPAGRPQSANLVVSDSHAGQTVIAEDVAHLNAYSWEIVEERANHLVDSTLSICEGQRRAWPLDVMNLLFAGDIVTGEDIYVGQSRDIDRILVDQIIQMAELLVVRVITPFLEFFPTVRMYATWGNHGRLGQRRGQKAKRSNADYLLYHFIRKSMKAFEDVGRFVCYISQSPMIGFATEEAPDYNILLHHGHNVRRYMSIPYYGLERWSRRMMAACGVFWHYVIIGHHHRHAEIDASHGEMIINGAWVGPTDYALDELQDTAPGKQVLFGLHPEHGITWRYPVWLSPRPQMQQDPHTKLYTPVYEEGTSYSMRP